LIDKSYLINTNLLVRLDLIWSTPLYLIDTTLLDRHNFTWSTRLYLIDTTYWSTQLIDRHDLLIDTTYWSTWLNLIDMT
jgi:hypothetical protein